MKSKLSFILFSILLLPLIFSQTQDGVNLSLNHSESSPFNFSLLSNSNLFPTHFKTTLLCTPHDSLLNNFTNSPNALAHCFTYTILGSEAPTDNLERYQYEDESNLYWLKEGLSYHFIFNNDSYDVGITNISYDEFVQSKDWIENNWELMQELDVEIIEIPTCLSGAVDDSFIVRNSTNNNVIYINSTGSLCLVGGLTQRAGNNNLSNYNLTYDLNGNLVQDNSQYYEYNGFNQLIRVREKNSNGPIIEEYLYDQGGNRIFKNVVKAGTNESVYYIGDEFVHVINASGKFNTTFYYADGVLVAEKDHLGNKKFYHPDHLGSTSLITNSSGGIVEETFYEPFGDVLEGATKSRYNYNSKEKDGTGLNYYGARYYKSTQSQFTQPDSNLPKNMKGGSTANKKI